MRHGRIVLEKECGVVMKVTERSEAPNIHDEPLERFLREYLKERDLREFMTGASDWILDYCRRRLSRDPDEVGDFYLHFYERAERCLNKYLRSPAVSFTGYLAAYLRHEYMNFRRRRRRPHTGELKFEELVPQSMSSAPETALQISGADRLSGELNRILEELPLRQRLVLKLHYGFELGTDELRDIVRHSTTPVGAARFLADYHRRCENNHRRLEKYRQRAAYLNYLIHNNPEETRSTLTPEKMRRWKERVNRLLLVKRGVVNGEEIATLLGVNRSTVARRMERSLGEIKRGIVRIKQEQMAESR